MKKHYPGVRFLAFTLLLFLSVSGNVAAQDNSADVKSKIHNLARVHQLVRKLPFTEDYIQNTVMAGILDNRKKIAPHFPERHEIPKDMAVKDAVSNWIANYPAEYNDYIAYVESTIRQYHHK